MREDLLKSHFVDTAQLKRFICINDYNEREYEEPIEISCRKTKQTKILQSSDNESIVSTITIYTFEEIGDKDNIDGKDVLQINQMRSLLDNKIVGYEILI